MVRRLRAVRADEPGLADEDALRTAYQAHGAELYRFALRQLGDEGAAQDVVQDVFLRAWRSADRFDPELASLRVWLFAIARNVVVDHARARAARPAQPTEVLPEQPVPFDDSALDAWVVEEALARIGAEHRSALIETYLRGRPYAEVAAEQGIPVGTVRSRVFYGLKQLRLVLDEMGVAL